MFTRVKTAAEIENMRTAGKMLATVLDVLSKQIKPGMSEKELAAIAASELKALGGEPSFLGYNGFPDVICISVNDAVVHGIPGDREFREGDIVSLDFGVTVGGMVTDSAITVPVGSISTDLSQLVSATKQSLMAGIKTLKDGVHIGDIGAAVQAVLDTHGYGIVRELVGHGVGHELHESPDIPNIGKPGNGPTLQAGMTVAIEPMANLGERYIYVEKDGWTIRTQDGKPSAHFEHTLLVTENGSEIITQL